MVAKLLVASAAVLQAKNKPSEVSGGQSRHVLNGADNIWKPSQMEPKF